MAIWNLGNHYTASENEALVFSIATEAVHLETSLQEEFLIK